MRTRSWRTTSGIGAQVFVAAALAYTAKSLATLAATGAQGEIGVYNEDTKAAIPTSAAYDLLPANTRLFIAMKTSTGLKTSQSYTKAQLARAIGGLYNGPVKQVSALGFDGTTGDLNIPSLTTPGLSFSASYLDISSMSQPADARTYNYVSRSGDTEYIVALGLLLDYARNLSVSASYNAYNTTGNIPLHYMDIIADVTTATGTATVGVTYGSKTVTASAAPTGPVNGDFLRIGSTTGKTFGLYKLVAGAGTTTLTLDRPYTSGPTVASLVPLGYVVGSAMTNTVALGLKFTAYEANQFFKLSASESLADSTYQSDITAFKAATGAAEDVKDLEYEGNVFAGHSTANVAFAADFGAPDINTVMTYGYSLIFLTLLKNNKAVSEDGDAQYAYIVVAGPMLASTAFVANPATTLTGTITLTNQNPGQGVVAAPASPIIELADVLIP